MANKSRGRRPKASDKKLPEPAPPLDHNDETPKFCLHHLCDEFDVPALTTAGQAAFAKTLHKLAQLSWKDIHRAPRHGQGTELIPRAQVKARIPTRFEDTDKFMAFRYDGKLPMLGVRIRDVYHVLWIEPEFNQLYDHGSS
jgi:hypothetical protein